ncbi:MAG: biotin/lipoyl-containing protein, partial [Usitatibacter sp.]
MQVEVKVPQLSESVSEATLVAWRKKAGEPVKRDENLIDVETDKVVLELPAPADGVLVKIVKNDGESVTSGELIALIDTEGKATATAAPKPPEKEATVPAKAGAPSPDASAPAASPSAAKIAAEKGIDTSAVAGTGRDGRVTKGDVLQAPSGGAAAPVAAKPVPAPIPLPSGNRAEQRVPMSRLRQRIAERLVQS